MDYVPRWLDALFPVAPAELESGKALSSMPRTVPNPPNIAPTSPLTRPISILSGADYWRSGKVSRQTLMSIPAFRKATLLACGVTGTLPYQAFTSDGERVFPKILGQPERTLGLTRNVTFTQTALDIWLEGSALWAVLETDSTGFPSAVKRVPTDQWSQDPDTGAIIIDGEKQKPEKVRLFTGAFDGLLSVAGPTVRLIQQLDRLTGQYCDQPQAREYLKGVEGLNLEDDQVEELLADYIDKRRANVTAYLPPEIDLGSIPQMTPEQMTLVSAQMFAVEQVSRLTNIDAFWLGAGKNAGLTYSNRQDQRFDLVDMALMPALIRPIEERLGLGDVTPRGTYVRANLDVFLRANTLERYQAHAIALDPTRPFKTPNEIRELENLQPIDGGDALYRTAPEAS